MAKRKHITLSIKQKTEIIDKLEQGVSGRELAKTYGVGHSTISDIKKNSGKIKSFVQESFSKVGAYFRKTLKKGEYPEMESKLYSWLINQHNKQKPVSLKILSKKAKEMFMQCYNKDTFVASRGWLLNFKGRYGLPKRSEENLSNNESSVEHFIKKISRIIKEKELLPSQIYNVYESGLFWKLLPDRTLVQSKKTTTNIKTSKERINFLACTNGDSSHRLKLLVIGKSKKPRSFANKEMYVEYTFSKNASITSLIFKDWFQKSFCKQVKEFLTSNNLPEKALLLIKNAPNHCSEKELICENNDISILILPKKCAAMLQPMDQNAIRLTKLFYRKSLLDHLLCLKDQAKNDISECLKTFNLQDALRLLHNAWEKVPIMPLTENHWDVLDYEPNDLLLLSSLQCHQESETFNNISAKPESTSDNELIVKEEVVHLGVEQYEDNTNKNLLGDINNDVKEEEHANQRISHEEAIKCFTTGIQWAEEHNISVNNILVLNQLREEAISRSHRSACENNRLS